MATQTHDIGDVVAVRGEFRDATDALVTPTTRSCLLKTPDGAEAAVGGVGTVVSVGIIDFTLPVFTAAGPHYARIKGSGGIQAVAAEITLLVRVSKFVAP